MEFPSIRFIVILDAANNRYDRPAGDTEPEREAKLPKALERYLWVLSTIVGHPFWTSFLVKSSASYFMTMKPAFQGA
jgi:hypothetical protein